MATGSLYFDFSLFRIKVLSLWGMRKGVEHKQGISKQFSHMFAEEFESVNHYSNGEAAVALMKYWAEYDLSTFPVHIYLTKSSEGRSQTEHTN